MRIIKEKMMKLLILVNILKNRNLYKTNHCKIISNYVKCNIKDNIKKFKGIHSGKRAFVIGNGPSLNKIDMTLLKDEVTFGSNRVYLGFKMWGYNFRYWTTIDPLHISQFYQEYNKNLPDEVVKFVPIQYFHLFKLKNCYPINIYYNYKNFPQFSCDYRFVYEGWTVTYVLLQLAVIMGCNPIYLVGVDYSYSIGDKEKVGDGNKWVDPESKSHFIKGYCAADKGVVWTIPRFDKTDKAFKYAAKFAKENGIEIYNATPGSRLQFFPFIDYNKLFDNKK